MGAASTESRRLVAALGDDMPVVWKGSCLEENAEPGEALGAHGCVHVWDLSWGQPWRKHTC